jgi:hypothetical protein
LEGEDVVGFLITALDLGEDLFFLNLDEENLDLDLETSLWSLGFCLL